MRGQVTALRARKGSAWPSPTRALQGAAPGSAAVCDAQPLGCWLGPACLIRPGPGRAPGVRDGSGTPQRSPGRMPSQQLVECTVVDERPGGRYQVVAQRAPGAVLAGGS